MSKRLKRLYRIVDIQTIDTRDPQREERERGEEENDTQKERGGGSESGTVHGTVTVWTVLALFGCLCRTCCPVARGTPLVLSCWYIHSFGEIWDCLDFVRVTPSVSSLFPLTSWVPLSSFLPCILVLPLCSSTNIGHRKVLEKVCPWFDRRSHPSFRTVRLELTTLI